MSNSWFLKLNRIVLVALVPVLLAQPAQLAGAGLIDVEAQLRYDFAEFKKRGEAPVGDGHFSTSYNFGLRRPILPSSTLISDLNFSSSAVAETYGRQNNRNWTLNLYSRKPKHTFIGRISHSDYGTAPTNGLLPSTGYSTGYNASLLLNEPAYPVVNIQFLRNESGSSYSGTSSGYASTTWITSAYYDLAPLRFTFDRTRQTYDYSSSTAASQTQRSAVLINHSLMPGLTLSGELSKYSTTAEFADGSTTTDTFRRLLRLSMTPTRAIAADIDFVSQSNDQDLGSAIRHNDNNSISWNIRSEIMRGLSFNYADQRQSQVVSPSSLAGGTTSRNRNIGLSARLADRTILNLGATHSEYNLALAESNTTQDALQMALQAELTPTTDLNVNYTNSNSTIGSGQSYDSTSAGISLRDRTSDKLSLGLGYRRTDARSLTASADPFHLVSNTLDLDMLWLPTYDVGLNLRLSYQSNNGANISDQIAPSVNFRWQVDSSTSLTLNYALERVQQWDWISSDVLKQHAKGLSLHLTHGFPSGSSVDVSYDFHGASIGELEWQRQLRLYFTTRL